MTSRAFMRRLDRTRRVLSKTKQRKDLNFNKNYVKKPVTYAERKARKEKWTAQKQDVKVDLKGIRAEIMTMAEEMAKKHGNTKEYWYNRIMQESRLAQSERKVSTWNAFQSMRLNQVNAGIPIISIFSYFATSTAYTMLSFLELPEGEAKKKVNDPIFSAQISEEWKRMSADEKIEVTKDQVARMTEDRETRVTGENNTGISAFHDCRATLEHIEKQVCELHMLCLPRSIGLR